MKIIVDVDESIFNKDATEYILITDAGEQFRITGKINFKNKRERKITIMPIYKNKKIAVETKK